MSSGSADGQVETVAEFKRRDGTFVFGCGALVVDARVVEQLVNAAVEHADVFGRARIPALDDAVRVAAREQLVDRVELAAVVLAARGRLERRLEAALLQVESEYFVTFTKERKKVRIINALKMRQ